MVQQQLIDYVKGQLKQGYTITQVRSALISAGYTINDVDLALHAAGTKHVTTGMLVVAFICVLALVIGIIIFLHASAEPPAELDATVSLFTPEVAPGDDLVLSVTIKNSGGSTNGLIDVVVTSSGKEIARQTQDFSVTDETTLPITVRIPEDAPIGNIDARAELRYGPRSTTATAPATITTETTQEAPTLTPIDTVKETAPIETAREQQQTCATTCDDLNFCTRDTCDAGKCVNVEAIPCCGNRACESGENDNSCAVDCADEQPNPDTVTSNALAQATSDFSGAIKTCQSLGQQNYVDLCLSDVANAGKNKQACADVGNAELRDGCYVQFAYSGDSEACTHVENPSMQGSCEQLVRLTQMQAQYGSG